MALFKRFPNFNPARNAARPLVPPQERGHYPAFADDFETLDHDLMPRFRELSRQAAISQNWHRWMYILLIFGGAAVTVLGIIQIAFISASWIGIIGGMIAVGVGTITAIQQRFNQHKRYLNARLAAERLRSEYFLFLGHIEPYDNENDRVQQLIARVADIKARGEKV